MKLSQKPLQANKPDYQLSLKNRPQTYNHSASPNPYNLTKQIYQCLVNYGKYTKLQSTQQSTAKKLADSPQILTEMLIEIKQNLSNMLSNSANHYHQKIATNNLQQSTIIKKQQLMIINQLKNFNRINQLQAKLTKQQKDFKNIQIKLLNNIKKSSQQLNQKSLQIAQLQELLTEKQNEIQSLIKINQKKYRKIRLLEEDVYDLELKLQEKNMMLEVKQSLVSEKCEKFCNQQCIIYQQLEDINVQQKSIEKCSIETQTQQYDQNIYHSDNLLNSFSIDKDISVISVQTDEEMTVKEKQLSDFLENKQSKYLQSIQRLTFELSQAYERINQLTQSQKGKQTSYTSNVKQLIRKTRTTSSYFCRNK